MNDVLTLILGGGRGTRLFPLTHMRSKPAVPLGGKYRLIDIPISNCLHAGLKRIFVLTQFNSASLNRHIAQTYRLDMFSDGFVEVLAAEQTPESSDWFQGTADAVRQAARHFIGHDAEHYLILAGDHLYRMDFTELLDSHIESRADITIAAQPVNAADATEMGIFRFDQRGQIGGFEEKPKPERLAEMHSSIPRGALMTGGVTAEKPFVASMGIYVFSREVLLEILDQPGIDFGKEIIPRALSNHVVNPYVFRGYWADVGTIDAFYRANIQLTGREAPFDFFHPAAPNLHAPSLSAGHAHV
jgi:glucose-1-phosphate adenylyltransferase